MPTKQELERALINADAAGDVQAATALANALKSGQYDQPAQQSATPTQQQPQGFDLDFPGSSIIEPAITAVSSAVAEPFAGVAGAITGALTQDPEAASAVVEGVRERMTFQPRTEGGEAGLQALGETLAPVGEAIQGVEDALGNYAFELTGSPAVAAGAESIPTALAELVGLKGLGGLKRGTRLKTPQGRPTPQLRKALEKEGLNYDNLSDATKQAIPETLDTQILPGASSSAAKQAEQALINELKSGARTDNLAGVKLIPGRGVVPDKAALETIRQGFPEGVVQTVKTATPETRARMAAMVRNMRSIQKEARLANELRPSNVAGNSLANRVNFIRKKANDSRKELNRIANQELKGLGIDTEPVLRNLAEQLDNIDVTVKEGAKGLPEPVFTNSLISKNRAAQRAVKDAFDLLSQGGTPDGLRVHKLKRQFDDLIDFKKKSAGGLSDSAQNFLKSVRASLNDVLREANVNYAGVNDDLSQAITAFDNLQSSAGRTIDIFGEGAENALGTRMRALLSNQQGRVNLENSIKEIDELAKSLGGKFGDDIEDLVLFANALDNRFGPVAKTSLGGEVGAQIERAMQQGATATTAQKAAEVAGKSAEKLRGINDFNAFNAMEDLITGAK